MDCLNGQISKMAGVMNSDLKKMVNDKIDITEDDIPGAKISRESIEQCSVVLLKRWLLCRGAKTSGKKATLITRYEIVDKLIPKFKVHTHRKFKSIKFCRFLKFYLYWLK